MQLSCSGEPLPQGLESWVSMEANREWPPVYTAPAREAGREEGAVCQGRGGVALGMVFTEKAGCWISAVWGGGGGKAVRKRENFLEGPVITFAMESGPARDLLWPAECAGSRVLRVHCWESCVAVCEQAPGPARFKGKRNGRHGGGRHRQGHVQGVICGQGAGQPDRAGPVVPAFQGTKASWWDGQSRC